MGRRRCCCNCYEYEDDFERSNSSTIGGSWLECDGDSAIEDGRLKIPAGGEVALNEMQADVGEEVGLFYMDCEIYETGPSPSIHTGAKYQIVAFVGSDGTPCSGASNEYIIEMEITGSAFVGSPAMCEITYRLFGPDGQIGGDQVNGVSEQYLQLAMCVGPYQIVAGKSTQMDMWTCPDEEYGTEGRYFAIRNDGTVTAYVDWAKYIDHYDHDKACPDCRTNCCCTCIEDTADRATRTLIATIYHDEDEHEGGDHNNCSGMNGTEVELMCSGEDFKCCTWQHASEYLEFGCNNAYETGDGYLYGLKFVMHCDDPNNNCEGYRGYLSWPTPGTLAKDGITQFANHAWCSTDGYAWNPPVWRDMESPLEVACDCVTDDDADAVNITFGPFQLLSNPMGMTYPDGTSTDVCFCCAEFYIVVTTKAPPAERAMRGYPLLKWCRTRRKRHEQ